MADFATEEDPVEEDPVEEDAGRHARGQADDAADPLAGWDEHGDGAGSADQRTGLPDGTVLALVGLLGAVLGAAAMRRRRAGAVLGGFAGLLLGMIERRLWEGR